MNLDIQFDQVSVNYGDVEAVRDVSFQLDGGKIYGLLGRNGAGKTSLLSVLASFREPSSGKVTVGGEPPSKTQKSCGKSPSCMMSITRTSRIK